MSCVADESPAPVDDLAEAAADKCGFEWRTKDNGDVNKSFLIRSWMRESRGDDDQDGPAQPSGRCGSGDCRLEPAAAGGSFDRCEDGTWSSLSLLQMRRGSMASVGVASTGGQDGDNEKSEWIDNLLLEALEEHSCGHLHLRHKSVMFHPSSFNMDSSLTSSQKMDVTNSTSSSKISRGVGRSCKCRITLDHLASARGIDAQAKIVWKLSDYEKNGLINPSDLATAVSLRVSLLSHPFIEPIHGLSIDTKGAVWSYGPVNDGMQTLETILVSRFHKGKTQISKLMADIANVWLDDVVEALSFMHSCSDSPIYHGCLRPSSVLISNDSMRATLSDVILNDEIHKRRALTAESDIRDVGFLIWQIARSRIIVFDSGQQTDSAAALTGGDGVEESHLVAECDVAAKMIVHRGMRGLFKRCVYTPGSNTIPCRSMNELAKVMCLYQRKDYLGDTSGHSFRSTDASQHSVDTSRRSQDLSGTRRLNISVDTSRRSQDLSAGSPSERSSNRFGLASTMWGISTPRGRRGTGNLQKSASDTLYPTTPLSQHSTELESSEEDENASSSRLSKGLRAIKKTLGKLKGLGNPLSRSSSMA